ncbi:Heat shock factor protein HSF8 [Pyrenophora tritici-repentis]|uniref:Heat shock factor protein HSF8 n=1 Tax=Pyrenophora tritici-repentis (strain Pt-1C-BFP) TaxID=426418 RepID=B2VQY3_PYRTR|nr:heat shock factor protein HSF8 [Pyrenophora tritici-repentis Pt-1C-BFP]EDU40034.1 heat shock factor protein HSF8 [Pyrenophora tritici-repentis Pt-1C-BFP]KAI1675149.1 Heat shock factor protein HSF8 [Pyrenophora tritici-repentis]KAI1687711.1 Heat shock factor protein HSF8 [Pyrenophora tritici-repentis]
MSNRKRRAPGASPQAPTQTYQHDIPAPADQYINWNESATGGDMNFNDPPLYDNYGTSMGGGHNRVVSLDSYNDNAQMSGQLVRRNTNQQLAPAPRRNQWDGFPSPTQQWETVDDDEELEQKAALAKKDAQAKRKQIPPFVQKLSSFLDNNKNENLIRWSDDGNSFIVLDEDEFARTLIPELFKHNNYASFVRQLNMYGFHKKVGLSDNSMKASETKAKAPSEYYNKYFKRGRQELLWLIQKPKNPPAGPKRKRDEEHKGDSDEDRKYIQDTGGGGYVEEVAVRGNEQMAMIPRSEYNSLRVEVRELQQQQKLISNVLTQIKRQNEELYSRATSFQALHDRHENSINAILTFLATFYNRSLEGNANMNLADMFPGSRQQPHGNVVDVDDYPMQEANKSPHVQRNKKPLAILPAPGPNQELLQPTTTGRATTISPTTRPLTSPTGRSGSRPTVFRQSVPLNRQQSQSQSPYPTSTGRDSSLSGAPAKADTPSNLTPVPENDAIMSAIQDANASAGQSTNQAPDFDYAAALSNYQTQDGHVPLTQQQRNDVLSQIVSNTSAQNTNNALTNPNPPEMARLLDDLAHYQATQQQLEMLQKLSDQQNHKIQNIHERILPLSPTGQIEGIGAGGNGQDGYFDANPLGEPGNYDLNIDNFVHDDDFFTDNGNRTGGGDVGFENPGLPDFNFDTAGFGEADGSGGAEAFTFPGEEMVDAVGKVDLSAGSGDVPDATADAKLPIGTEDVAKVESASSNSTSPAATVEEVEDETRRRSPKRRRK